MRGVISALETDYPVLTLLKLFPFYRSDLQKKEYGLATPYRVNPLVKFFFRNIMSLPFIPKETHGIDRLIFERGSKSMILVGSGC